MNGKDFEITLLTREQVVGDNCLDVIKRLGTKAHVSDFAISLGASHRRGEFKENIPYSYSSRGHEVGGYAIASGTEDYVFYIDINDKKRMIRPYTIGCGIRPVIKVPDVSKYEVEGYSNGIDVIKLGKYPLNAYNSTGFYNELTKAYREGKLTKLDETITINGNSMDLHLPFKKETYNIYRDNSTKKEYIMMRYKPLLSRFTSLSNGTYYERGSIVWIEVVPLSWYVCPKENLLICQDIILSGIRYCNSDKYDGDFKNTNLYKYLNTYFARDIGLTNMSEKEIDQIFNTSDEEDFLNSPVFSQSNSQEQDNSDGSNNQGQDANKTIDNNQQVVPDSQNNDSGIEDDYDNDNDNEQIVPNTNHQINPDIGLPRLPKNIGSKKTYKKVLKPVPVPKKKSNIQSNSYSAPQSTTDSNPTFREFLKPVEVPNKSANDQDNPYNLDFSDVSEEEIIRGAIESGIAVFLHGPSSEGKSARVKQIDPDCTIIYLRNATPESLNGKSVYNSETKEMIDIKPTWLVNLEEKCNKEPDKIHILFFDEISNALPSIQGFAFNIVLDREVNGKWELPSNARIVAAGNEMKDSLAANQLAEPLFNRFAHVYIKTTTEGWLKWASDHKIHPAIYAYIAYKNGETLRSPYDGEKPNADPRKWEMASKILYATGKPEMIRSLVGEEITQDFVAFCRQKVITIEDVIKGNYTVYDIQRMNAAQKYATVQGLSHVDDEKFKIVRDFAYDVGREFGAMFDSLWAHGDERRLERIAEEKYFEPYRGRF